MESVLKLQRFALIVCLLLVLLGFLDWNSVQATCSKPSLLENSYTFEKDKESYRVNETYEIVCIPAYVTSDNTTLTCMATGRWSPGPPLCSPSESAYPWWMLLVAVMCVILLLSCVLPRFIHCFMGKKRRKKKTTEEDGTANRRQRHRYEYDDRVDRLQSPVHKIKTSMNNIEYTTKQQKNKDGEGFKKISKTATF